MEVGRREDRGGFGFENFTTLFNGFVKVSLKFNDVHGSFFVIFIRAKVATIEPNPGHQFFSWFEKT